MSSVEMVGISLIVGFIFYLIGVGYYAKFYFPTYDKSWTPLRNFLEEKLDGTDSIDESDFDIDNEFIYRYHTLFWLELDQQTQRDLRFYYSFYLFSVSLFMIISIYIPFRISAIILGVFEYAGFITEFSIVLIIILTSTFLFFDGRRSLKSYHDYFTYLGRQKDDKVEKVLELIDDEKYENLSATPFA